MTSEFVLLTASSLSELQGYIIEHIKQGFILQGTFVAVPKQVTLGHDIVYTYCQAMIK